VLAAPLLASSGWSAAADDAGVVVRVLLLLVDAAAAGAVVFVVSTHQHDAVVACVNGGGRVGVRSKHVLRCSAAVLRCCTHAQLRNPCNTRSARRVLQNTHTLTHLRRSRQGVLLRAAAASCC